MPLIVSNEVRLKIKMMLFLTKMPCLHLHVHFNQNSIIMNMFCVEFCIKISGMAIRGIFINSQSVLKLADLSETKPESE